MDQSTAAASSCPDLLLEWAHIRLPSILDIVTSETNTRKRRAEVQLVSEAKSKRVKVERAIKVTQSAVTKGMFAIATRSSRSNLPLSVPRLCCCTSRPTLSEAHQGISSARSASDAQPSHQSGCV